MKQPYIVAILLAATLFVAGCNNHKPETDLTDAQKLEVLDLRLERNPKDAHLLADRAKILLSLHRTQEAMFDITRAIDLKPEEAEYRLIQADIYFSTGDANNCYKALGEAERLDPESKEVQLKMGEVTFYRKDYERSLRHLTKVTEQEPDNRTALSLKAFIYKEQGDTANAVVLLRKVCDIYPDYAPAFETLGVLYASRHDPMAVEYLSTAMRLDPSNTNILYALGMYYQEIEQYDEAEKYYHQILDINANSTDAWNNLGYIALAKGDKARAAECFDKALEADPNNEYALTNRNLIK